MDFAILPPEINSGRMYDGPGSGPMLAAATAWDGLATELHSLASSYGSVISELSAGPWRGAASAAMTAAAAPYVAWMGSTAGQAEQAAVQARAAAAAYEVTFAAMVPPPAIAANRLLLQVLVAGNLLGQNSPAIAATEALYAEMWAQDATAMSGYAGASASATTLTAFTPPPQTTNRTPAPANTEPAASQSTAAALQGLTSTAATDATSASALDTLSDLSGIILFLPGVAQAGLTPLNTVGLFTDLTFDDDELRDEALKSTNDTILNTLVYNNFRLPPEVGDTAGSGTTRSVTALGPAEVPSVTAGLGQAPSVGRLSVPRSWTVAAPEIRLTAMTLPTTSLGAAPEVMAASPGTLFSEMTLANMAGRALGGTPTPRRPQDSVGSTMRARPAPAPVSGRMTAIAADVHEFAEALVKLGDLRDCGLLTDEEFIVQKERLLAR